VFRLLSFFLLPLNANQKNFTLWWFSKQCVDLLANQCLGEAN
jgi:hypothetical protein